VAWQAHRASAQYDAKGRRENAPGNYMTIPGSGEVLNYTPTGGSTLVPLHDYLDSTLGLVGASNTLQTQWSYELFGVPVQSGSSSGYAFLFGARNMIRPAIMAAIVRGWRTRCRVGRCRIPGKGLRAAVITRGSGAAGGHAR
jgi:hypothetical protein